MLLINLTACKDGEKKRYETEFLNLFDTVTRIVGYADSEEEFTKQVQMIHDDLEVYHQLYDIYNDYPGVSNIKTINDQAGLAPVKVDQKIIDLLKFSQEAYNMSDGKVNVAMGAVLKIWHDHREAGTEDPEKATLPSVEELQAASEHTDINQMFIDEKNNTVFLKDPKMSLDVGAIAKGYATEMVSKFAEKNGVTSMLLSVGGNVRSIGKRGDGAEWKVGVQNPYDQNGKNISKVSLTESSLVTSGIYERYYRIDGKIYHHIIDPVTLFPASYFVSVTILCPDSGMADALSTAVFNVPFEEGKALIERLPDTEALWAFADGTIKYSSHFKDYVSE
ncbi:FAD:protein FMN transferase [Clostridium aminobutyricum]|uniref:FAD:protein FMN transferase n=2 Tax=Clostridium aminobutyricum TaxID=33953 RepID=A0A939DAW1_CLOAM|nr:FAD:protein FMN transferase [Clostridium aminobutyricum]MBN7774604.1 FAD:protein FMN transferase [Clostridium aminobutyricum]